MIVFVLIVVVLTGGHMIYNGITKEKQMDINDGVKLVTQYIYDRKKVRADINTVRVMTDQRQQELLKQAVKVAVEYYNGTKIIV